jgi:hypothetical protein
MPTIARDCYRDGNKRTESGVKEKGINAVIKGIKTTEN